MKKKIDMGDGFSAEIDTNDSAAVGFMKGFREIEEKNRNREPILINEIRSNPFYDVKIFMTHCGWVRGISNDPNIYRDLDLRDNFKKVKITPSYSYFGSKADIGEIIAIESDMVSDDPVNILFYRVTESEPFIDGINSHKADFIEAKRYSIDNNKWEDLSIENLKKELKNEV